MTEKKSQQKPPPKDEAAKQAQTLDEKKAPIEIGGRKGLEPTRFGDWEMNGKCVDF